MRRIFGGFGCDADKAVMRVLLTGAIWIGGAEEIRTLDLCNANAALYHLSYSPKSHAS